VRWQARFEAVAAFETRHSGGEDHKHLLYRHRRRANHDERPVDGSLVIVISAKARPPAKARTEADKTSVFNI
jgi:hypothetical protein